MLWFMYLYMYWFQDEADFELAILLNSDLKNVLNHLILHLSTHKDRVLAGLCMLMTQADVEHLGEQQLVRLIYSTAFVLTLL